MIQTLLVAAIFLGALAFLTSLLVKTVRAKEDCASGCGKCNLDVKATHSSVTPRL